MATAQQITELLKNYSKGDEEGFKSFPDKFLN